MLGAAGPAHAADYVPGEVLVGYVLKVTHRAAEAIEARVSVRARDVAGPREHVVRLPHGVSIASAIAALRRQPGVAYAVPTSSPTQMVDGSPTIAASRKHAPGGSSLNGTSSPALG